VIDPRADIAPPGAGPAPYWDRGYTSFRRRAYYFKFLIASSGPDQTMGIPRYGDAAVKAAGVSAPDTIAQNLILIENQAAQSDLGRTNSAGSKTPPLPPLYHEENPSGLTSSLQGDWGLDDITNHKINAPGTGLR
jgi:hypothetical protein